MSRNPWPSLKLKTFYKNFVIYIYNIYVYTPT